ncbi:MAG: endo alpha-1,4 polygalactosaminidase [Actinomycetes bacterium]
MKFLRAATAAMLLLWLTGCSGSSGSQGVPSPSLEGPSVAPTTTQSTTTQPTATGSASASQARPSPSASTAKPPPANGNASGGQKVTSPPTRWRPMLGTTWQWQLSGPLDLTVKAQIYDVDLFDTSSAAVRSLHAQGRRAVCYFSAGSWEPGRPDSGAFPAAVKGQPLEGFADERWLDIRRTDILLPLMAKRLDLCRAKGFDGAEPDNVDGYANQSGFPLTGVQQLRYNRALAALAHARGLAVALKNDLDQVSLLAPAFDFAVNEQCAEYGECNQLAPFVKAGKPVLHVEYNLPLASFCPSTRPLRFSSLLKHEDLGAYRLSC